ncbi:MAG: type II toxin-antitoxin system HicA family toxin [Oscillospiraceae bacterium]|nr:type II toxin-antitoxin system HicA family toxin [Oscillospiraceae bacterium]
MAGFEKTMDKMKRQPHGISYEEAAKVLEHFGYKFLRQKGSHCHFRHLCGDLITIKKETPTIKKCYVVDILSKIE